ncbi:cation-translocating P-type ATPase [Variovorax sp. OV329]|uniref:heavy metal translocating P-type ATPase n=1 Tax=Variovorax sp. OV329 TaxID=1882825 RepID=UPI0008E2E9CF|nr:heavy metal translocating P-type ATPase [Variovorax sp. OV329]SFM55869.1 Cd2+/Zn2+-exporting ATPase [Variovorax sp. OV329]
MSDACCDPKPSAPKTVPAAAALDDCCGCGAGAPIPLRAPAKKAAHGHEHHDHGHDHAHAHEGAEDGHDHGPLPGIGRLAASLVAAISAELLHFLAPDTTAWHVAGMALAALAIALAGIGIYQSGLRALLRGKLGIDTLMTVAVTGAFLIGQWPEAAMVMALYALAELIEHRAADRARHAISSLMALAPEEAEVMREDGSWQRMPARDVAMDATVRVRPGERLPFDGDITAGQSAIDQSSVTGESIPVDKGVGDAVFAGTINQGGELQFRVTAPAGTTTLDRIIHAVEEAQATRAPTQRFVDRFAAIYTPAVFAIAVAVAVLPPLLMGWAWVDAIYKALVLLVIACPCALVLSTPVTVVSALTSGARRGILIKGGNHLEAARLLKAIALDKTGTITEGKPKLVHWQVWGGAQPADVQRAAAGLAGRSDHPVSRAILAGIPEHFRSEAYEITDFKALPGRGTEGRIAGDLLVLGNHRLVEDRGQCGDELEAALREHERQGRTVTLLASARSVIGLFAVADTVKPTARAAIAELEAMGVAPVMLTGDNEATARAVASQAGLTELRSNLLPEEKQGAIRELQQRFGPTGMTGDGINDAPALAQADIGFAMGKAGTDIAMEAADVVIMNDDLRRLAETVRLSRRTHGVLWQNISLALGIKLVFLLLAVAGQATMWMAVFADMGASLLVIANGLRLLRHKG